MLWQEHSPFSLLNNYKHLPLLIKALLTVQLLGYVLQNRDHSRAFNYRAKVAELTFHRRDRRETSFGFVSAPSAISAVKDFFLPGRSPRMTD